MDLQHAAHHGNPVLVPMLLDERVLYSWSLAKYAAAFFKMSPYSWTRLRSAFNFCTSSRALASSSDSGAPGRAFRTQIYSVCAGTPMRSATSLTG